MSSAPPTAEPPAGCEQATAEQIRRELRAVLDGEPFGIPALKRIATVATAGQQLLQALSPVDPALLNARRNALSAPGAVYTPTLAEDIALPNSFVGGSAGETFGATALRELKELLPRLLDGRRSPTQIVQAMAVARREGLPEVEAALRAELDVTLGMRKRVDETPAPKTEDS